MLNYQKQFKMEDLRMSFEGWRKNPVFVGDFSCAEDVFCSFFVSEEQQKGLEIIYAAYHTQYYEGYATVYFYDTISGKYYEVHGSHCSCFGLENQWNPEEVSFEGLEHILKNGNSSEYSEMRAILSN